MMMKYFSQWKTLKLSNIHIDNINQIQNKYGMNIQMYSFIENEINKSEKSTLFAYAIF